MRRFNGTLELTADDLAGTAFLVAADRAAKGLPPLPEADLGRVARTVHHRRAVDSVRRENGTDGRGNRKGVGARVGLTAPGAEEGTASHADPTAYDPAAVAMATDLLGRMSDFLSAAEVRLVMGKAAGYEGDELAERAKVSPAAARKALQRARAKVAAELLPGGILADLGAEGFTVAAPKGGRRTPRGT